MTENTDYLALAYLGDAVLEIIVRRYLVERSLAAPQCHEKALSFVTANNQARAVRAGMAYLTEEEKALFTRAKNAKAHSTPRSTDPYTYRIATGLEAVLGDHWLKGEFSRCEELFFLLYHPETNESQE